MIKATIIKPAQDPYQVALDLAWDSIRRAAHFFWEACQTTLNIANPSKYTARRKRDTKAGKKGSSYTAYKPVAGMDGKPPFKRTGFGAANVLEQYDKDKLTARVGVAVNAKYMAHLELRKNRPWLLYTLDRVKQQLQALAGQ